MLQKKDIVKLNKRYGLGNWQVEQLAGGHANNSFLLQGDQGDFVLTVFNTDPLPKVIRLGRILQWLAAHNFSTTRLIPTAKGSLVTKKWGKPILLKHYVVGEVQQTLGEPLLYDLGREIGRLHQIPAPPFLSTCHDYKALFPILKNNPVDANFGQWLIAEIEQIATQLPAGLPKGFVHGDIFWDNVLIANGNCQAIIDFERAHYQVKLFDIAMAIVGTCVEQNSMLLAKAKALIDGYESLRMLQTAEKQTLQLLIQYCALLTACWRFWKYHLDTPSLKNEGEHRKMLQIAKNTQEMATSHFMEAIFGS